MEEKIKQLEDKVAALEKLVKELKKWKDDRVRQQLTNPLDYQTKQLVKRAVA